MEGAGPRARISPLEDTKSAGDGKPTTETGNRTMKTLRYLTIGTTLALAMAAGSAGPSAVHKAACTADALSALFHEAPTSTTCGR